MMNDKTLLSKKRSRQITKSKSHQLDEEDTPTFELNGYNVVELLYTESISNKKILDNDKINFEESSIDKIEFHEKKTKIKEVMTKSQIKEIEEYYTSQYGISKINENCFICLMNSFLSNELLYFNSRLSLFNYCKDCFLHKSKKIFVDEKIYKKNKEQFFSVNQNFINSWRFFIPKTICKGCFLQLINQKDLIYSIKKIFSDTDNDSSCKTNYRNYAKFSKLFRKEFKIGVKTKIIKKEKSLKLICIKKKPIIETIEISDSETIDINNTNDTKNIDDKRYNSYVEYDKIKNIIFIDKSIFNESNNINKNDIFDSNKIIWKNNYANQEKKINNIITFQGQNYINIINNININTDNSINNSNTNLIKNLIELIIDKVKNSVLEFGKFESNLKNVKDSMFLIFSYLEESIKKLVLLLLFYRNLLKASPIKQICNSLFLHFKDNKTKFEIQLFNLKNTFIRANDFIDNIYNKIDESHFKDEKERNELLSKIQNVKLYLNENIKFFDISILPLNNFEENFYWLLNLMNQIF